MALWLAKADGWLRAGPAPYARGSISSRCNNFRVIESLAAQRAGDAAKIRLGPLRGNAPPPDAAPGVCDTRPTRPLDQCNRPIWYGYRADIRSPSEPYISPAKSVGAVKAQEISRHYSAAGRAYLTSPGDLRDWKPQTHRMHAHRPKVSTDDFQSIETALSSCEQGDKR